MERNEAVHMQLMFFDLVYAMTWSLSTRSPGSIVICDLVLNALIDIYCSKGGNISLLF
jgi:hypothetical protein